MQYFSFYGRLYFSSRYFYLDLRRQSVKTFASSELRPFEKELPFHLVYILNIVFFSFLAANQLLVVYFYMLGQKLVINARMRFFLKIFQ